MWGSARPARSHPSVCVHWVSACAHACRCARAYMSTCVHVHACMPVSICPCACICLPLSICAGVCVCMERRHDLIEGSLLVLHWIPSFSLAYLLTLPAHPEGSQEAPPQSPNAGSFRVDSQGFQALPAGEGQLHLAGMGCLAARIEPFPRTAVAPARAVRRSQGETEAMALTWPPPVCGMCRGGGQGCPCPCGWSKECGVTP